MELDDDDDISVPNSLTLSLSSRSSLDGDGEGDVSDDEEEEEEEDASDDEHATSIDADVTAGRVARPKVNKGVYDALMRDEMASVVLPTSLNREAAKLLEQGFNPDGTPLSKRQIQRMNQRAGKAKAGKR